MGQKEREATKVIDLKKGKGLELGPLFSPVVKKGEADIAYLDHASQEELKQKYALEPIALDKIVPVDYVLKGSLKQTVGRQKFDYVIAAHVIEHIPDTVRWLKEVAEILNDRGILSLVIPDKRFTFDITRDVSRPAHVIGAYLDKHTQYTSASMYDATADYRDKIDPGEVWANPLKDFRKKPRRWSAKDAYHLSLQNLRNLAAGEYSDCHCFVYTPHSFVDILRALIEHGLLDYEVAYFKSTPKNSLEFYVSLRKSKASKTKKLASLPKLAPPRDHVKELTKEIQQLRQELHSITHSKSWKITKPLRAAMKAAAPNREPTSE